MKQIRNQIDGIDNEILKLLKKRMKFVIDLGKLKKKNKIPITDKKREKQKLEKLTKKSEKMKLNQKFIIRLYNEILKESRSIQKIK